MRLWVEIFSWKNRYSQSCVSLFVRLWVEIVLAFMCSITFFRQPLREAVSWNVLSCRKVIEYFSSASSWGCELKYNMSKALLNSICQPLREAVSWNDTLIDNMSFRMLSASSWGCELKYFSDISPHLFNTVSLFVRLWVEIVFQFPLTRTRVSASSWGCELK